MKYPIFSIITVVFNGEKLLEGTIQSVIGQTYPHIEYIIVDGNSKDGTVNIIKKYREFITQWISEPDKGLYDAMNKGQRLATGDYLLFLNCGDHLFEPNTLEKIISMWDESVDVFYGDAMLVDEARKHIGLLSAVTVHRLPEVMTWKSMKMGMSVCHQAFFARRTLAPEFIENNLVADMDWVIKCLKKSQKIVNTGLVISEFLAGGVSKQRHRKSLPGRYDIMRFHYGFFPNLWYHFRITMRALSFKIKRKT